MQKFLQKIQNFPKKFKIFLKKFKTFFKKFKTFFKKCEGFLKKLEKNCSVLFRKPAFSFQREISFQRNSSFEKTSTFLFWRKKFLCNSPNFNENQKPALQPEPYCLRRSKRNKNICSFR